MQHERIFYIYPGYLLSIELWSIWLCVFPSGDVQVNLRMLRCGNIVLLRIRFLDVAKFTTLIPISLLIWCKLSFPIVGLKMSSLPILPGYTGDYLYFYNTIIFIFKKRFSLFLFSDWLWLSPNYLTSKRVMTNCFSGKALFCAGLWKLHVSGLVTKLTELASFELLSGDLRSSR
jgi:hypothetical protein